MTNITEEMWNDWPGVEPYIPKLLRNWKIRFGFYTKRYNFLPKEQMDALFAIYEERAILVDEFLWKMENIMLDYFMNDPDAHKDSQDRPGIAEEIILGMQVEASVFDLTPIKPERVFA